MTNTAKSILAELKPLGRESYKKIILTHGAREPIYGVSIAELKKIQKRVKRDHELALALYDTGVYDAMYLAGLIADDARMTKKDLQRWVDGAYCPDWRSTPCRGSRPRGRTAWTWRASGSTRRRNWWRAPAGRPGAG